MNFIICLNLKILLFLAQDKTAYQEYFIITLMHINSVVWSTIPICMLSVMFVISISSTKQSSTSRLMSFTHVYIFCVLLYCIYFLYTVFIYWEYIITYNENKVLTLSLSYSYSIWPWVGHHLILLVRLVHGRRNRGAQGARAHPPNNFAKWNFPYSVCTLIKEIGA